MQASRVVPKLLRLGSADIETSKSFKATEGDTEI